MLKANKINHKLLDPGIYCVSNCRGIITIDIRLSKPNISAQRVFGRPLHSLEHLLAWYFKVLSPYSDEVISICPGACGTMFYLELYEGFTMRIEDEVKNALLFAVRAKGVPFSSEVECGSYRFHKLQRAKRFAEESYKRLFVTYAVTDEVLHARIYSKTKPRTIIQKFIDLWR